MGLLLYLLNNLQAKRSKHRKDIFHGLHVDSISESLTAHTPHVRLKSFKFQDFVVIALKKEFTCSEMSYYISIRFLFMFDLQKLFIH